MKVSLNQIQDKIKKVEYHRLPNTNITVCVLFMENGHTITGQSACVDPREFNRALGEQYAYDDAIRNAWPLEGYLLQERMHKGEK